MRRGGEELSLPWSLISVGPTKIGQDRGAAPKKKVVSCLGVGGGPSLPRCEGLVSTLQGSASLVVLSQGHSQW